MRGAVIIFPLITSVTVFAGNGLFVDWAVFYSPSAETARLEVYVGVPLDTLVANGDEAASYDFNVGAQLVRVGDGAIVGREVVRKKVDPKGASGVKSPMFVGQLNFSVPPGDYKLTVGVGDLTSGQSYLSESAVQIPARPAEGVSISSLEIANTAAPVEPDVTGEFIKNNYAVVPNPTKLLPAAPGALIVYYELYGLAPGAGEGDYTLRYDIYQLNGRRFLEERRRLTAAARTVARLDTFDLSGYPSGAYKVVVAVNNGNGEEVARGVKEFVIYQPRLPEESPSAVGNYRLYSPDEEKRVRKELSIVAEAEELAAFDALPPEEKPIFVENFWARRDPAPETPENEFKNTFFERYQYVQEHFSTPFREGVDTDRGRVYMKYGEPDMIIRSPMGLSSQVTIDTSTWLSEPFEAWEYYTAGGVDSQYILFVFVDFDGDGSYEIDAATVPGYGKLLRAVNP